MVGDGGILISTISTTKKIAATPADGAVGAIQTILHVVQILEVPWDGWIRNPGRQFEGGGKKTYTLTKKTKEKTHPLEN